MGEGGSSAMPVPNHRSPDLSGLAWKSLGWMFLKVLDLSRSAAYKCKC